MKQEECVHLLSEHGIKPTANRIVVVRTLALSARPLTMAELEERILSIDKSGIFRTVTLFREHHLVHAVEDGIGALRYELCHSHGGDEDDDLHVHFFCERCQRTFCLDGVPVPQVAVPPGYLVTSASHLVRGVCPDCENAKRG
ncbi:MAG: transcriptional repressor [Prevotella sp.]|nr:transcriptional repressor [Prevotella sp.]